MLSSYLADLLQHLPDQAMHCPGREPAEAFACRYGTALLLLRRLQQWLMGGGRGSRSRCWWLGSSRLAAPMLFCGVLKGVPVVVRQCGIHLTEPHAWVPERLSYGHSSGIGSEVKHQGLSRRYVQRRRHSRIDGAARTPAAEIDEGRLRFRMLMAEDVDQDITRIEPFPENPVASPVSVAVAFWRPVCHDDLWVVVQQPRRCPCARVLILQLKCAIG
mmetsp:Transcript_42897/g.102650  ORF Transcript_42897/g.102650 Transcript_42897/m.102650 type:complete len:217 (-) Transcript_42897:498-1148(-)